MVYSVQYTLYVVLGLFSRSSYVRPPRPFTYLILSKLYMQFLVRIACLGGAFELRSQQRRSPLLKISMIFLYEEQHSPSFIGGRHEKSCVHSYAHVIDWRAFLHRFTFGLSG